MQDANHLAALVTGLACLCATAFGAVAVAGSRALRCPKWRIERMG